MPTTPTPEPVDLETLPAWRLELIPVGTRQRGEAQAIMAKRDTWCHGCQQLEHALHRFDVHCTCPTCPAVEPERPVLVGRDRIKEFVERTLDMGPGVLGSEQAWASRYLHDVRFLLEELGDPIITGRDAFLKRIGATES